MDDLAQLTNASATYDEIAENGPPTRPLDFPDPIIGRAARVTANIFNPETGEEGPFPNIIYHIGENGELPQQAFWIGRKLKKAIYGCVRSCTILRLRDPVNQTWEITPQMAAVKLMDRNIVNQLRGRHMEDPIKELSCTQFMSLGEDGEPQRHPNVMSALAVLQDNQYIYFFMPFCDCGELFGYVERDGRFAEPVARHWFRQILGGIYYLQKKGVCHRDMSLENMLVDRHALALIIDMGMCLRVPFASEDGSEPAIDVSGNTLRRLISPQSACGKPNYISPEVLSSQVPFDGFAIDVWAAGVILFIMLIGLPPFDWASDDDPRFKMITNGRLVAMVRQWGRDISDDAGDLLQKMLMRDPSERLSLMEVMDHKWIVTEPATPPTPPENEDWRH